MTSAVFVRHEDAAVIETKKGFHNQYFGERSSAAPGPQAFMVNYPPGFGAVAHFHHVNQYQVFFGEPGCTYQRHQLAPVLLHYAQSDTLYGPFGAGESTPLRFLTLRQNGNDFTGVMPDHKDLLPRGGHRTHLQQDLSSSLASPLPKTGESIFEPVFPRQSDGVCAFEVRAGGGAEFTGPSPADSGGQYYVVLTGSVQVGAETYPALSVGWCPIDGDPPRFRAGKDGTRLVILRFGPEAGDGGIGADAQAALREESSVVHA